MLRLDLPAAATRRGVFTRAEAIAAGWTPRSIRTQLARGAWTEVSSGAYAPAAAYRSTDAVEKHRLAALACGLKREVIVSGLSAAAVHRLLTLRVPTGRVRYRRLLDLFADDICTVDDAWVTTPQRTVADCARERGPEEGLVIADSALRRRALTMDDLREQNERFRGFRGSKSLQFVTAHADERSESVLESFSRSRFICAGLPKPRLQAHVGPDNHHIYRVDFLWSEQRTIGEADGLLKYNHPEVLRAEKRRQMHLEDAGYEVVRWTWAEMWSTPAAVVARVERAYARAKARFGLAAS